MNTPSPQEKSTCLVTGAGGFVGKALCLRLLQAGHAVRGLARSRYPHLESAGVRMHSVDLADPLAALDPALQGVDVIFHVAAKVEMWGPYEQFFASNVLATRRLIERARALGVKQFVFTSSPSVVAGGKDLCAVDERQPYPTRYEAYYPQTKAMAEREVLAAHGQQLATIALRPHLIFGPGDTHLVPTILQKAALGQLLQIGNGENLTDLCFIDDCVQAHLDAWHALSTDSGVGGKAYFISQEEPVRMWDWINDVLQRSGQAPITRKIPTAFAYVLACALETVANLKARALGSSAQPRLTRFLVHEMATSHYFNISAARKFLGFVPRHSIAQAMQLTFAAGEKQPL